MRWCMKCQREIVTITPPICERCGRTQGFKGICARCTATPPGYTALRSWAAYTGPLRSALHRLKYNRDVALGEILARPMIDCLSLTTWKLELVLPVPISLSRRAERGYNQAALLARPIALCFGLKYRPQALKKSRETRSQVGLTVEERRANVLGAFVAEKSIVKGKNILVVDDVTTSGATLNACGQALRMAGANEVYCLTLARAL
jgi:competence protein ComFC